MARPLDPDARRHPVSCRVNDKTRAWLELWRPGGLPADQLADVLERAQQFWSAGPDRFGHAADPTAPKKPRLTPAIARYATAQGITKAEAMNAAWKAFEATMQQQKPDHAVDAPPDGT